MSCISHINYTASAGSGPINVKNGNRLQWMAGQTGSAEEGFILLFIYFPSPSPTAERWFLHPHHPDVHNGGFHHCRGESRLNKLGGWGGGWWWWQGLVFLVVTISNGVFTIMVCRFSTNLFQHQRVGHIVITASVKCSLIPINWWRNAGTWWHRLWRSVCSFLLRDTHLQSTPPTRTCMQAHTHAHTPARTQRYSHRLFILL